MKNFKKGDRVIMVAYKDSSSGMLSLDKIPDKYKKRIKDKVVFVIDTIDPHNKDYPVKMLGSSNERFSMDELDYEEVTEWKKHL